MFNSSFEILAVGVVAVVVDVDGVEAVRRCSKTLKGKHKKQKAEKM